MSTSQAVIKIFSLATIAFVMAMALTPLFTNFVYKYKFGKKIRAEGDTPIYSKLHEKKNGTPTMGGILVWLTTIVLATIFWFLDRNRDRHPKFGHLIHYQTSNSNFSDLPFQSTRLNVISR